MKHLSCFAISRVLKPCHGLQKPDVSESYLVSPDRNRAEKLHVVFKTPIFDRTVHGHWTLS